MRKFTEEHKRKIGLANKGSKHGLWLGDKVSYKGLQEGGLEMRKFPTEAQKHIKCVIIPKLVTLKMEIDYLLKLLDENSS